MKHFFEIYLDKEFLDWFQQNKPDDSDEDEKLHHNYASWKDFYFFLKSKTAVKIKINNKIDPSSISEDPRQALFRFLLDKATVNNSGVSIIKENQPYQILLSQPPYSKYQASTIKDQPDCRALQLFKEGDIIHNWNKLRFVYSIGVSSAFKTGIQLNSWEELKHHVYPSNAIIICDNYLFAYFSAFKNNLSKLIEAFLPNDAKGIELQIIIVTQKLYKDKNTNETVTIDEVYNRIFNHFDQIGYKKLQLTLVLADINEQHDRHIYTNYQVLKSGNSFNYFNQTNQIVLNQPTTLDIQPLIAQNGTDANSTYAEFYQPYIEYVKDLVNNAGIKNKIGPGTCRLFE